MKIGSNFYIEGDVVREGPPYRLKDNRTLKNLVVSSTYLMPGLSTRGHSHEGLEEVYIFTDGEGVIQVDKELYGVSAGSVVVIPAGAFHKVCASDGGHLGFLAIFQAYDRPVDKPADSEEPK